MFVSFFCCCSNSYSSSTLCGFSFLGKTRLVDQIKVMIVSLDSRFWFLVFGFWFLVFGFWFLVFGFWFLVFDLSVDFGFLKNLIGGF